MHHVTPGNHEDPTTGRNSAAASLVAVAPAPAPTPALGMVGAIYILALQENLT